MAPPSDTILEIPPPEPPPAQARKWPFAAIGIALAAGIAVVILATRPRLPPIEWELGEGPIEAANLGSLVAYGEGFAILSGMTAEGVLLWRLTPDHGWSSTSLDHAPSRLVADDSRLIAYGGRRGVIMGEELEPKPISFPDEIRSRQRSGRASVVPTRYGLLAMTIHGDVWLSEDDDSFAPVVHHPAWGPGVERPFDSACHPPSRRSPDVPPVVETDDRLVTMISSNPGEPFGIWPTCEPEILSSDDGSSWEAVDASLGEGAYVYDLMWRDDRFIAVGGFGVGKPAVWTSVNGSEWDLVPSLSDPFEADLFTVEAGPAGWLILGQGAGGQDSLGWTSFDGLCWEPLPPGIDGSTAAVSSEAFLVVDRASAGSYWLGTVTSEERDQCLP